MFIKYLIVFVSAMFPFIELHGSFQMALDLSLNKYLALGIAILGNMVLVPVIYIVVRKLLEWGRNKRYIGKAFTCCLLKGEKIGKKLLNRLGNGLYIIMFLIMALGLPGIGIWLVSLFASIFKLSYKKTILVIILGILVAGIIMFLGTFGIWEMII